MQNKCVEKLKPIGITVISGVQVNIVIPEIYLLKGKTIAVKFCLTKPETIEYSKIVGTEVVYIQNGVGGELYQLLDCAADIFYGTKLVLDKCDPICYILRFGNNGLPSSVKHFINLNTPCRSKAYDPANGDIGSIQSVQTSNKEA